MKIRSISGRFIAFSSLAEGFMIFSFPDSLNIFVLFPYSKIVGFSDFPDLQAELSRELIFFNYGEFR